MKKLHAKSACCGAKTRSFGYRRKQCKQCGRTWRNRPKKPGRKAKRIAKSIVVGFLRHASGSSRGRAVRHKKSASTLQRDLIRSRDLYSRTASWPSVSEIDPLILIPDAKIIRLGERFCTIYCFLAKSPPTEYAVILPPFVIFGLESQSGWNAAFESLPASVLSRITAIVCDGHVGMINYAKRKEWIIQRCHFHILAAVHQRRSSFSNPEGRAIRSIILSVLSGQNIQENLSKIRSKFSETKSVRYKEILRGFVLNHRYFLSYLEHPELNLPTTSNTAEVLIRNISDLLSRLRGVRTKSSLERWLESFVKFKKTIRCQGKYQPSF